MHTFLFGECITGAGGEGGPLGIFLFVLNKIKKHHKYIIKAGVKYGCCDIHVTVDLFNNQKSVINIYISDTEWHNKNDGNILDVHNESKIHFF